MVFFETGACQVPCKSQNPTVLGQGGSSTGWQICIGTILGGHCEVMDWFRKKILYQKKMLRYIAFKGYKTDLL